MTVKELIEQLKKMPQEKRVELVSRDLYCGEAMRVIECKDYVEIESDKILM